MKTWGEIGSGENSESVDGIVNDTNGNISISVDLVSTMGIEAETIAITGSAGFSGLIDVNSITIPETDGEGGGVINQGEQTLLHTYAGTGAGDNFFLGLDAGNYTLTTAFKNIVIGSGGGSTLTIGGYNVIVGQEAADNAEGDIYYSTIIGARAGRNIDGLGNTVVGFKTMFNGTGGNNVILGREACDRLSNVDNSVIIGRYTARGRDTHSISNSVILGTSSGKELGSGANTNVVIGYNSLIAQEAGSANTVIGCNIDNTETNRSNYLNLDNVIQCDKTAYKTTIRNVEATIYSIELGIGGTYDFSGKAGIGTIIAGDNVAYLHFAFSSDGSTIYEITANGDTSWSDTADKLCVFANNNKTRIKNNLGATTKVLFVCYEHDVS
jgi:hypothetical protein